MRYGRIDTAGTVLRVMKRMRDAEEPWSPVQAVQVIADWAGVVFGIVGLFHVVPQVSDTLRPAE